jgi:hypothetical protein
MDAEFQSMKYLKLLKKAGRSWHHHSCALRRRSIGAGGMTGCGDYAQPLNWFPRRANIFAHS